MLLTIHDMNLRQVASIDNDKQDALNYTNDKWHRYLETGSSTFEFTVFKRSLKKDTGSKHAYHYLNNKAFVSFEYEGEVQLFKVRKIVENEKTITCSCVNLNLELINEYANPFKSEQPKTFKEYCEAMDLLNFTLLTIGVNEISDKRIKAEWTGQDTKLARLLSLANKFGAELEFKTYLNDDSSIKSFVVNIYHENDDTHHGVGRIHAKPLRYGKDFKSLIRTVDNTNIYNAVRPTGKAENGDIVTIGGMEAWSVNNEYGEREFYQQGELLYAPLSMQMFPSAFTSGTMADQWIRKDITVDSADKKVIRATAYRELKKHAYPDVSYEVEGFIDRGIGDTVFVYDDGFVPTLLLRMRVVEQEISSTNPSNNRTRFANFKTLDNLLPDDLQKRIDELFEASQPYLIKLATDNGVIFKNGTGQSIVTPTLYKGGKPLTANVTWRWSLDGAVKTGMTYTARGADVTDTSTLTVAAYIGNDEVAVDELTFVNVLDGRDGGVGPKGDPGNDGVAGRDGNKVYTSIYEMSANQSGIYLSDLTPTANPANLPPIGSIVIAPSGKMYPIIALNPTSTPPSYTAGALVGNIKGPQGDNGQTPVVHWAYSDNADGTGLTISDNGQRYIGHYSDYTQADSTDKTKYRWADRWAKIEVGGRNYLRNSSFVDGVSYWQNNSGAEQFSWRSVPEFATQLGRKGCVHLYSNGLPLDALGIFQVIQDMQLSEQEKITLSFDVVGREGNDSGLMVIINNHLFDVRQIIPVSSIRTYSQFTKTSLERKALTFTIPKACDAINVIIIFHGGITGDVVLTDFMLERGLVATSHQESPSDIADRIGVKADQALTQEQLNLLNERAQILDAELKAKASMDALSDLEKAYQSFVKSNADSRAKAEADLAEAGRRIELLVTQFGGFKELKTFIDTYMSSSNEGLIIGKNDASSTIKVSSDRISMFSAGKEVMYISQGVIHIDNGIFTASVQIGRFRTEQYHLNADMNVVRYVG
ncbi:phage tail spike protein [Streptococcus suis]|uniref:phage tail spike protein n=1 Tax=Streptococcus suis TaxID=1307 RepID=UPI0004156B45|nr:phage tail spike protein [Streptococcus suis]HEM3554792.1 phage tail protein [Streptococcus suis]HEM3556893.1 phage tail protein [Streptococcus suis]